VLCVLGGILVVVGGFLPVFRVVAPDGIVVSTVKGTEAGIGMVFLGGFAIFKGASALASGSIARLSSPLITAAFLTLLLVFRWNDINDAQEQVRGLDPSLTGQIGIGFWLDVLGTILIAVSGLMLLASRRSS
jgi:formate-dependent nitrite reductase membrane component NrfD